MFSFATRRLQQLQYSHILRIMMLSGLKLLCICCLIFIKLISHWWWSKTGMPDAEHTHDNNARRGHLYNLFGQVKTVHSARYIALNIICWGAFFVKFKRAYKKLYVCVCWLNALLDKLYYAHNVIHNIKGRARVT